MKKVCVLTTVHFPDDNRVFYKELQSLKRAGYDITYIVKDVESGQRDGINYVCTPKYKSTIKRILSFCTIYNLAKKQKCDVYHFHDSELLPVGIMLKLFTKAKVIYDVHEDYPSQMLTKYYLPSYSRKFLFKIMTWLEKIADKKFDAIITADNFVYNHFKHNENRVILYNYPDIRLYNDQEQQEKKYDIIFPGSMAKFTANMILNIANEAKKRGTTLKCALISPFKFDGGMDWVKSTIESLGLNINDFLLMKRIPPYEVPKYIKSSKVGLIPLPDTPKMRSNIPTKMFEYMYCSVPVITGDLPPSAQFFKDGDFGYLVDPNSLLEYTDKVLELVNNPDLARQKGETGKKLVTEKYNWENEEKKLIDLYKKILG